MAVKKEVNKYPVVPEKLRDLLKFNGWSISKISRQIDVSSTTINKEINDGWVKKDTLVKMAKVIKYSKADFFSMVCFRDTEDYLNRARREIEKWLDQQHK